MCCTERTKLNNESLTYDFVSHAFDKKRKKLFRRPSIGGQLLDPGRTSPIILPAVCRHSLPGLPLGLAAFGLYVAYDQLKSTDKKDHH